MIPYRLLRFPSGALVLGLAVSLAALAISCRRSQVTDAHAKLEAAHAEVATELPRHAMTLWNATTELFLEHPTLLAGQATGNWAIHLTRLADFRPVTEGVLTVRFLASDREVASFMLDAPARAGIFLLDPVVAEPGSFRVELSLSSSNLASVHNLPAVTVFADAAAVPVEAEAETAGGIGFLKEQQWATAFSVAEVREEELARAVPAPGEVRARDGALAEVSAPVTGLARAEDNRGAPSVGERVRAGQVLVVLAPVSGEGGFARSRAELARLEREAARTRRLVDAGAVADRRLEEVERELAVARAELAALGVTPETGATEPGDFRYSVRAPISGVIAERAFVPGRRVEAGTSLFTVVDPSVVWLQVHLPPEEAGHLSAAGPLPFHLEGSDEHLVARRLVAVGSVLDPATRTVPALFEVENSSEALRIGQYVRLFVPIGSGQRGLTIPTRAILDESGQPVAFVQREGESFERRRLRLGASDGPDTLVLDGLRAGDRVVVDGAYQVRLASLSTTAFSGGHNH